MPINDAIKTPQCSLATLKQVLKSTYLPSPTLRNKPVLIDAKLQISSFLVGCEIKFNCLTRNLSLRVEPLFMRVSEKTMGKSDARQERPGSELSNFRLQALRL